MRTRTVVADKVKLHVVEDGDPKNPGILFLHGFPDCHRVWEHQMRALSRNFHVIAFDMRGCGQSTKPRGRDAWRIEKLLPDIAAVISATRGRRGGVHLVGHDWGSVIGWSFVADARYAPRVLSWTSLSGPHIGLTWQWLRRRLQSGNLRQWREAAEQIASSWYIVALNVPGLGHALFRFAGVEIWQQAMRQGGVAADDPCLDIGQDEVERLALSPINLYRQNAWCPPPPLMPGTVTMPVQLLVATRDRFLRPSLFSDMEEICPHLERVEIAANHWAQRSNAAEITLLIREFVKRHGGRPTRKVSGSGRKTKQFT